MVEIEASNAIDEQLAVSIARSYRATWIERGREVTMVDGGAEWLDLDHGHDVSPPPPFLTYALGWWSGMLALLTDGRVEILSE